MNYLENRTAKKSDKGIWIRSIATPRTVTWSALHRALYSGLWIALLGIPLLFGRCSSEAHQKLILPLVQQSVEFTYPSPLASLEKKHRVKRRLLEWIDGARSSLLVAAYGLDDRDIIQALIRAEHRGVQVRTILSPESKQHRKALEDGHCTGHSRLWPI